MSINPKTKVPGVGFLLEMADKVLPPVYPDWVLLFWTVVYLKS